MNNNSQQIATDFMDNKVIPKIEETIATLVLELNAVSDNLIEQGETPEKVIKAIITCSNMIIGASLNCSVKSGRSVLRAIKESSMELSKEKEEDLRYHLITRPTAAAVVSSFKVSEFTEAEINEFKRTFNDMYMGLDS